MSLTRRSGSFRSSDVSGRGSTSRWEFPPDKTTAEDETPRSPTPARSGKIDRLIAEFAAARDAGDSPRVEDFLARLDSWEAGDGVELLYQDYCFAEAAGLKPDPSEYAGRFPQHRDRLERLLRLHSAFDSTVIGHWGDHSSREANLVGFPRAGDEIGPYLLTRELGRGGLARVFLARQTNLEDRLVVVKIAARPTAEVRLLAKASHPHIVEVLSHAATADGAFHLICMPFLGGATLATVLAERRALNRRPKTGREFLADLDRAADPEFPRAELTRPAREILLKLSYPRAIAWIVARLAEALEHAHRQGVSHGDVKPSNVLLAADGQPMLFDFNLAVDWSGQADIGEAGGTLAYMAPERLRAIVDPKSATAITSDDRHRADIYSLGLILLEALSGRAPVLPKERTRGARAFAATLAEARARGDALNRLPNSSVPASLRPILTACLAGDPAERYDRASRLAEDLDRWRVDRAPKHAREPVWRFGPPRWIRRQRFALGVGLLTIVLGAIMTFFAARGLEGSKRRQALDKLAMLWNGAEPGVFRFQRSGLWRQDDRADPAEVAQRILARYDAAGPIDWRTRDDVRFLPQPQRDDLEIWMLEQTWRLASALAARPDSPEDWRRALNALEREYGARPLRPLADLAQTLRLKLGSPAPKPSDKPNPHAPVWMEEYLRGIAMEADRVKDALEFHRLAVAARPDLFWTHYRFSGTAFRLREFRAAEASLRFCVAARPSNPILHTQLAACLYELDQLDEALRECETAIALNRDLERAYETRVYIWNRLDQRQAGRPDFERYKLLTRFQGPAAAWKLQLDAGLNLSNPKETASREELFKKNLLAAPGDVETRYRYVLFLSGRGRTDEALAEVEKILAYEADDIRALDAHGTLLAKSDPEQAIRDFQRVIAHPRFEELVREKGEGIRVYHKLTRTLVRLGRVDEAESIARRGLSIAERYEDLRGESHYALALTLAHPSRNRPARLKEAAAQLVTGRTFQKVLLSKWFKEDPMFDEVRGLLKPFLPVEG